MPETSAGELIRNRAMWPDDFHDCIPRIAEVAALDLEVPTDLESRLAEATEGLLVDTALLEECAAALIAGHVVLQGPPGTGKSSLARAAAQAFGVDLLPVTAHEDWSTFEVIGRQELRVDDQGNEAIVPVDGHFTEAVIRCAGRIPSHFDDPANPQATWLLIDELNRAHPDKAFGELFSVLGTDEPVDVTLGYQRQGNDVLVVPRRFRVIATLNSVDRQFVNALSQGLRRRFTFVTVDLPPRRTTGQAWGSDASLATREFEIVLATAARRAARHSAGEVSTLREYVSRTAVRGLLEQLFEVVERVRYAADDAVEPFVAVGTASLLDTVELFLVRSVRDGLDESRAGTLLDWAASVKLVPLFDAGSVNREKLVGLARSLESPFDGRTRRALSEIASDGLFSVP